MVRSWVFWEVVVFGIPAVPSTRASCERCLCADRTPGTLPWCSCRLPCRLVGREDTVPPGTSFTPSVGSWYSPMEGGGRSSFQAPSADVRAVHEVHFISAVYRCVGERDAVSPTRGWRYCDSSCQCCHPWLRHPHTVCLFISRPPDAGDDSPPLGDVRAAAWRTRSPRCVAARCLQWQAGVSTQ